MDQLAVAFELIALIPLALALSWLARHAIRTLTRRAVRRAQERPGSWRGRLRRTGEVDGDIETRKRQRADAAARMLGHFVTAVITVAAIVMGLHVVGVNPVYAISSAGFVGFAIALSGQDVIKNMLAGTIALLEDRYAVGDHVEISMGGNEIRGTIDLAGTASIRLRTDEGATWYAGHSAIESVTNFSQLAATAEIVVSTEAWLDAEDDAAQRLRQASNDVGLTGVVFLPDLASQAHPAGVTTVTVRSNRTLTDDQRDLVKRRITSNAPQTGDRPNTN